MAFIASWENALIISFLTNARERTPPYVAEDNTLQS